MSNKGIKQKPSHAQIERWLKSQEVRLGIANAGIQAIKPTVTKTTIRVILVESESARLSRAHQGADATISPGDLRYALPPLSDMLKTPRRAKSKGGAGLPQARHHYCRQFAVRGKLVSVLLCRSA
jgi:hypothetical protein